MGQASCQEIVKGQDVPVPKAPPASGGSSACPRSPRSMAAKARSSAPVCNDTKDQMVTRVTANSGSNGNTGRRPSCLDPLPGAEPQTPAIESPRLKCPTSPRGLPGAASRVHGASDMELPAVAKMRTELAAKQKALQSLRQEGAQHKQLMEVLEQEAFQKDEDLRGLRVGEAARREAVALIAELRRKDADIDHLRKKVESEEGMLRALVVEAQTKGDAVEDLVTAITEQSMLQTGGPKLQALNKKLGAGTRICVLGGTKFNDVDTEAIVKAVAKELSASLGHSAVFITGGMPGVQETFAKHCVAESRLFNLLPDGQQSNYGVGEDIHAGSNLDERIQVYGQLGHVYISFEGGPGVSKEAKAAVARSAGVVPLIRTGGASGGMFDFPAGALKKPTFATDEQWRLLGSKSSPVADSARAAVEVAKGFVAQVVRKDSKYANRKIARFVVREAFVAASTKVFWPCEDDRPKCDSLNSRNDRDKLTEQQLKAETAAVNGTSLVTAQAEQAFCEQSVGAPPGMAALAGSTAGKLAPPVPLGALPGDLVGSTWDWTTDGQTVNGCLEFLPAGVVKFSGSGMKGSWRLTPCGRLGIEFSGTDHVLRFRDGGQRASEEPPPGAEMSILLGLVRRPALPGRAGSCSSDGSPDRVH
eukprot:gnl/TRDRNA2_/TRDRNA2_177506_c0_seq17.p1 gnl/TRDRNA2_/TRDRNA2_177506_c0~~gnl/TRDRNA2_/TRDRNA2_177506_c0_seq17.p1  ORF type:complete len:665 (-),score=126.04 gnl/TRDRNA2_/TRDRNA2_177506_c0_seq17:14-1948(-)